jgi:hypothetical protein
MKPGIIPIVVVLLSSCQMTQSTDPSLLSFSIPKGSTLSLNKDLEIPEDKTHALLQDGKVITDKSRNEYRLNCRFDLKKFGPRTIKPEVFRIKRTESGQERVSGDNIIRYYTDVHLASDRGTDVIKLTCQEWVGRIDRTFTVSDMETAVGDYFTFTFPQSSTAKQD